MALLFVASILLISHGSLFPYDFSLQVANGTAVAEFAGSWLRFGSRGDILGNILLFVPFGLTGMYAVAPRAGIAGRLVVLSLAGLLLATGLQVFQLFLPSRDALLSDVIWNALGWLLGCALAAVPPVPALDRRVGRWTWPLVPTLLIALWLTAQFFPFVPSIDLQSYKDSLKPLLLEPLFDPVAFLRNYAGWLALAAILSGQLTRRAVWSALLTAAAALVVGRIMLVNTSLAVHDLAAAGAALASWLLVPRGMRAQGITVGVAAFAALAYAGLAGPFGGIAESGLLEASVPGGAMTGLVTGVQAVAGLLLLAAALLYLLTRPTAARPVAEAAAAPPSPLPVSRTRTGGALEGRGLLLVLALLYTAFVVYGSLVPLRYVAMPLADAWRVFMAVPYLELGIWKRADWVANALLYIPLGFFWFGVFWRRGAGLAVLLGLAAFLLCSGLAIAVEFTQVFFPQRTVSQNDLIAEIGGSLIGVACWAWLGPRIWHWAHGWWSGRSETGMAERLLWVYLLLLFGYNVMPLDVTFSLDQLAQKWSNGRVNLIPFGFESGFSVRVAYALLSDAAIWIPAGLLFVLSGRMTLPKAWLWSCLAASFVEFVQFFIYSRISDITDIILAMAGAGIGVLLAAWFRRVSPSHAGTTGVSPRMDAVLRGAAIAVAAVWTMLLVVLLWFPFDFTLDGATLGRSLRFLGNIPFAAYYFGTEYRAITEVFHKLLFFAPLGAALAVAFQSRTRTPDGRLPFLAALLICGTIALVLEIGQGMLPARVADNTDLALELLGSVLGFWTARSIFARLHGTLPGRVAAAVPAAPPLSTPRTAPIAAGPQSAAKPSLRGRLLMAAIGVLVIAGGIAGVLQLPGIPYNVQELFGAEPQAYQYVCFALAMLSLGLGGSLTGRFLAASRKPWLVLPVGTILASLATYYLLSYAVSRESIYDIIGVPIVHKWVANDGLWGEFGTYLYGTLLSYSVGFFGELMIRFVAFAFTLHASVAIFCAGLRRHAATRGLGRTRQFVGYCALLFLYAAPWIYLAKYISIDFAATDNLTELVENSGFLVPINAVIALGAALLAHAAMRWNLRRSLIALAVIVLSLPLAWHLLQAGLLAEVHKYGKTFSATTFLLAPNRSSHLSEVALAMRWATLQLALTFVLAYGIRVIGTSNVQRPTLLPASAQHSENGFVHETVRLLPAQAEFIDTLSQQLNADYSATIRQIIDTTIGDGKLSPEAAFPDGTPAAMPQFVSSRSVALRPEQVERLQAMSDGTDVSLSRAIRHLVDRFVQDLGWEPGSPDDAPPGHEVVPETPRP